MEKKRLTTGECVSIRALLYKGIELLEICPFELDRTKILNSREYTIIVPRELFRLALEESGYSSKEIAEIMCKHRTTYMNRFANMMDTVKNNAVAEKFYKVFKGLIDEYNIEFDAARCKSIRQPRRKDIKGISKVSSNSAYLGRSSYNGIYR